MVEESPCGRPVLEDGKCIFHSNSRKDSKEFEKAFLKLLSEKNRDSEAVINCQGFVFPDFAPEGRWHVAKFINFDGATFSGYFKPNLQTTKGASFDRTRFEGDADFTNCELFGEIYFTGAIFEGDAVFDGLGVKKDGIDFSEAVFKKKASFTNVVFEGIPLFLDVVFNGKAWFSQSRFLDEAWFSGSTFTGNADFLSASFSHETSFKNTIFKEVCDFMYVKFGSQTSFEKAQFLRKANFSESRFLGEVNFEKSIFNGKCLFKNAEFEGRADFSETRFQEYSTFDRSVFRNQALFIYAHFTEHAHFYGCTFNQEAVFYDMRFDGGALFWHSRFDGEATFTECSFSGRVSFDHCRFKSLAEFDYTELLGETGFEDVTFSGVASFRSNRIGSHLSFEGSEFSEEGFFSDFDFIESDKLTDRSDSRVVLMRKVDSSEFSEKDPYSDFEFIESGERTDRLDFRGVLIRKVDSVRFEGRGERPFDLANAGLAFTDVSMMRFLNVSFSNKERVGDLRFRDRLLLWLINRTPNEIATVYDERLLHNENASKKGKSGISIQLCAKRWEHVGAIYKGLRESYERALNYDEAGQFHVREMEARRFANGQKSRSKIGGWCRRNLSLLSVYKWLSVYGESYRLAAIWIAVAVFLFAILRWLQSASLDSDIAGILSDLASSLGENLSTSLLAFLQLKSESTIDLVERITGAILVVLFGMALHRNFKR